MPISSDLFAALEKGGGLTAVEAQPSSTKAGTGSDAFLAEAGPIAERISKNIGVSPNVVMGLMMTNESRQCSAKTHGTGEPCRNRSHFPSGRCRLHGGASTGPKTDEGKARAGLNGRLGGRPRKRDNLHPPIIHTPQDKL